jgi:hypothetical protein
MVTLLAPETFQLSVTDCPELIISGLAVKELMTGGNIVGDTVGCGDSSGIIIQLIVKTTKRISDKVSKLYLNQCVFISVSFCVL